MIAGKVLMDRNCPEFLRDTAESGYADSKALIARWHGKERLSYAVTPRFAPTSSDRQLELAGRLLDEHPGVYLQTHVAENRGEVAWAAELFPWSRSYLDVYDRFGLVRPRSVYAHCIHLDDADRARMGAAGAAMSFCPTSNLFLGSGLFDLAAARRHGVRVGPRHRRRRRHELLACCARSTRRTRSRSSPDSGCRRSRRSTSRRWAARARCTSTIGSATSCPARRPISS